METSGGMDAGVDARVDADVHAGCLANAECLPENVSRRRGCGTFALLGSSSIGVSGRSSIAKKRVATAY